MGMCALAWAKHAAPKHIRNTRHIVRVACVPQHARNALAVHYCHFPKAIFMGWRVLRALAHTLALSHAHIILHRHRTTREAKDIYYNMLCYYYALVSVHAPVTTRFTASRQESIELAAAEHQASLRLFKNCRKRVQRVFTMRT